MNYRWKFAQFAELKWWQRYLKNKDPESYIEWKKSYWYNFLKKCDLKINHEARCLDLGCGPAGIFIIIREQKVDAVDPLIKKYMNNLNVFEPHKYPNVNFINTTIEEFKSDEKYDYIFCLNAINHVSDWSKSIDKIISLLKVGGTIIITTDVHRSAILKPIFRMIPGDILHPQQHSLEDYTKVIDSYKPKTVDTVLIKREIIFDYYAFIIGT